MPEQSHEEAVLIGSRELGQLRTELELARWRGERLSKIARESAISVPFVVGVVGLLQWVSQAGWLAPAVAAGMVYFFGVRVELRRVREIMEATEIPADSARPAHVASPDLAQSPAADTRD